MKPYIISDLEILTAGAEGKAIAKVDGMVIFVPFVVPGDIVDVEVYKKKKGYAEARLIAIKKHSPYRTETQCPHFGLCGGCKWQALDYQQQLIYKQQQVEDNFQHLGKFEFPPLMPILSSEKIFYYRNKLEFTFSNLRWLDNEDRDAQQQGREIEPRGLGFHIPGKFDKVLDIKHCALQTDPSNEIRNSVKEYAIAQNLSFYNIRNHEGLLRNIIIRTASTGEIMVIVVFTEKCEKTLNLMQFIRDKFPQITSLQYVINTKFNDSITDLEVVPFSGKEFIVDTMEDLTFKIGPVSFYQTNSDQAYQLYSVAREFAQISPNDIVYDLYTGTGTIANFVARQAKKVVGIEYVDAAIEDAKINSAYNQIKNTHFYAGDMKDVLNREFIKANGTPEIVITDPPRAGMHNTVIERLLEMEPKRIVYISCNPATQARDITLLDEKYKVEKIQPVDMFPHTQHVENVALLIKR